MAEPGVVSLGDQVVLGRPQLGTLLEALRADGYRLVGPRIRDGAIIYAEIETLDDVPAGWTEVQEAGAYRLRRRQEGGFTVLDEARAAPRLALIGARSCDLHAIVIQDRVFTGGGHVDPDYAARRRDVFVVAVNCGEAGGTCFCVSMNTGPRATRGFDLALTELIDARGHRFLAEIGSPAGTALLSRVGSEKAPDDDRRAADEAVARTAASMGRTIETRDIKDLLYRNLEYARWDDVAGRCLGCANCTLVCPTCFCAAVEDVTDLAGAHAERVRRWDSCFTLEHSYIPGGSVRASLKARYRQWLTHKLATWIDQFGSSGCVGCGRCITWCPVGIDITAEVAAIRASDAGAAPTTA